jgi:6-phosphofructokinase
VLEKVHGVFARGQTHALIVVAEGAQLKTGPLVAHLDDHVENLGIGVRATILGHVQRGGTPGPFDRLLGSRLGFRRGDAALARAARLVLGLSGGRIAATPLDEIVGRPRSSTPSSSPSIWRSRADGHESTACAGLARRGPLDRFLLIVKSWAASSQSETSTPQRSSSLASGAFTSASCASPAHSSS